MGVRGSYSAGLSTASNGLRDRADDCTLSRAACCMSEFVDDSHSYSATTAEEAAFLPVCGAHSLSSALPSATVLFDYPCDRSHRVFSHQQYYMDSSKPISVSNSSNGKSSEGYVPENKYASLFYPTVAAALRCRNVDLLIDIPEPIKIEDIRPEHRGWIPYQILYNASRNRDASALRQSWTELTFIDPVTSRRRFKSVIIENKYRH
jgi:hypothetical protein